MNNLALSVALATAPSSAFEELRERPRFWFPLLLLVATTAAINYWYFSIVDIEWLKDVIFGNNPDMNEAERAAAMGMLTRTTLLWGSVVGTIIGMPIVFLAAGLVSAAGRQGHQAAAGFQALVRVQLLDRAAAASEYRRGGHFPDLE